MTSRSRSRTSGPKPSYFAVSVSGTDGIGTMEWNSAIGGKLVAQGNQGKIVISCKCACGGFTVRNYTDGVTFGVLVPPDGKPLIFVISDVSPGQGISLKDPFTMASSRGVDLTDTRNSDLGLRVIVRYNIVPQSLRNYIYAHRGCSDKT